MQHNIRPYKHSDFETISSWWIANGEPAPINGIMVENGSFVLELDNVPSLALTILLTQSKELAFMEGFIKNPIFKEMSLEPYGFLLWNHCLDYARSFGYKRLIAISDKEKLFSKYERFGMKKTIPSMCFVQEL